MSYLDKIFGNNKLTKLKIVSYTDIERTKGGKVVEAMFNPETLSHKFTTKWDKKPGIGQSGQALKYTFNPPMEMKLKLVLDKQTTIKEDLTNFLNNTWKVEGKIHQPYYLTLKWGGIIFPCRLGSVDIKYTRFDRNGNPTAAELDIVLLGDDEDKRRILRENFSSPDLTHLRIVRNGDTLPLLCQDIYGDSCYYPVVALANDLDDFRNLQPGIKLYFPPLT
ncbi:MAG: hypothetical protein NTX45_15540 [Proteobacteria bacterium]|nr:hypothetical protein [Pseudomonadota bacterium]